MTITGGDSDRGAVMKEARGAMSSPTAPPAESPFVIVRDRRLHGQGIAKGRMRTAHPPLSKAPTGVEPVMEVLQTSALPLGYGAEPRRS